MLPRRAAFYYKCVLITPGSFILRIVWKRRDCNHGKPVPFCESESVGTDKAEKVSDKKGSL